MGGVDDGGCVEVIEGSGVGTLRLNGGGREKGEAETTGGVRVAWWLLSRQQFGVCCSDWPMLLVPDSLHTLVYTKQNFT
jgi:hypothetical protein